MTPILKNARESPLLTGSALYLLSNVISAAIPFALLPILTRYLSPSEYGEVAMFQVMLAGLAAFVGLTAVGAATRKYFDSDPSGTEFPIYVGTCFLVLVASSVLVFTVVFVFREWISAWTSLNVKWVLLSVLCAAASFVIQMQLGLWQVQKKVRLYGLLQIGQSIGNMMLTLFLVVVLMRGASGRIDAQIYIAVVLAGLALYLLWRDHSVEFVWRPDQVRDILSFGILLIPHIFGVFLLASFDRVVINANLGLADAGIYMVAVQLTGVMGIVFDSINKAYTPWLYARLQRDLLDEKRQIVRWTYGYFAAVLGAAGLAFLIGPRLTVLIAGERYADAGRVVGWLAVGQAFIGMYLMVTNYTFYAKRTGLLSLATIASGVINIGLLLLLVRVLGLTGAAIAFAASMAVRFFLTWFAAHKSHPMPWFNFIKPA